MPLFDPVPVSNRILRRSREGAEWTGYVYVDSGITVGHFFLPHRLGVSQPKPEADHRLVHYLLFENYAPKSVTFEVSERDVEVRAGAYRIISNVAGKSDTYMFDLPESRKPIGPMEGHAGPIGKLAEGRDTVHAELTLHRKRGPDTVPATVTLKSDGDWNQVKCPCPCSGSYPM